MGKQVQAVIFDMDGVIFDSERLVIECWEEVAAKHNIPDIVEICMRVQGNNREETGKRFREKYGKDFPYETYKKEVTALFLDRYGEGRLPMKPGVVEILKELRRNNIPLALASSTRSDIVKLEMAEANLLPYFDAVLGGDMVPHSKPEPDIFLKAAELIESDPSECLVIEDSHNGVRAAYRAGLRSIMVPDLLAVTDEMKEKATYVVKNLNEAISIISEID